MLTETTIVTVTDLKRLKNTPSGNPRWDIVTAGATYRTRANTMCAFTVSPLMIGKRVTLTLTPAGYVCGIDY